MPKKTKDSWPNRSANEIIEEEIKPVVAMIKERGAPAPNILSCREFIKLLRHNKTLADLDRLKIYNAEGKPITSVKESAEGIIIY